RGVNMPRAMTLLIFLVAIRSWAQLGFTTFVPFYYVDYLKSDPRLVGPLLFVFLGAGALGTVVAGPLADRWGARPFMRWVFLAAIPFGLVFLRTPVVSKNTSPKGIAARKTQRMKGRAPQRSARGPATTVPRAPAPRKTK